MKNQTVLYVDDNPKSSQLLTSILEDCGFRIITKQDPIEALALCEGLALCRKTYFDLVLLDYEMPAMMGSALAQEIKLLMPEIPVVLLSGRDSLPDEELLFVDAHFGFGTVLDDLLWTMRILVQHPQLVMAEPVADHDPLWHLRPDDTQHSRLNRATRRSPIENQREMMRWADST
jgi:CheY-like chemotaxis protein